MSETLSYNGYSGSIETSIEDECLHGTILFIEDIVTYEGGNIPEIKASFEIAVDNYISYCNETGKPANKPYSGTFNIRVGQEIHREAAKKAYSLDMKLNEYVTKCIKHGLDQNEFQKVEHTHHHEITIKDNQHLESMIATMDKPNYWEALSATAN